jgi:TetR/AcrR family transcriptional regulator, cholesterol catabolism regulator
MPRGVPLTEEDFARRRREILNGAAKLLLDRGYQATSMREIAEAVGVGKSTLYDYFQTKEQILYVAMEEAFGEWNAKAQEMARLDLPPEDRLRQMMKAHLEVLQADGGLLLRLSEQVKFLSPEQLSPMVSRRHAYQDVICGLILEGVEQGCFRKVDALVAARMLINAATSAFYTGRPSGTMAHMLDEVIEIFLRGIAI